MDSKSSKAAKIADAMAAADPEEMENAKTLLNESDIVKDVAALLTEILKDYDGPDSTSKAELIREKIQLAKNVLEKSVEVVEAIGKTLSPIPQSYLLYVLGCTRTDEKRKRKMQDDIAYAGSARKKPRFSEAESKLRAYAIAEKKPAAIPKKIDPTVPPKGIVFPPAASGHVYTPLEAYDICSGLPVKKYALDYLFATKRILCKPEHMYKLLKKDRSEINLQWSKSEKLSEL
jgi:hypothetical protein